MEELFGTYDADPIRALSVALRAVLDEPADTAWPELLARATITDSLRAALLNGEQAALDALAADLNEFRSLPPIG